MRFTQSYPVRTCCCLLLTAWCCTWCCPRGACSGAREREPGRRSGDTDRLPQRYDRRDSRGLRRSDVANDRRTGGSERHPDRTDTARSKRELPSRRADQARDGNRERTASERADRDTGRRRDRDVLLPACERRADATRGNNSIDPLGSGTASAAIDDTQPSAHGMRGSGSASDVHHAVLGEERGQRDTSVTAASSGASGAATQSTDQRPAADANPPVDDASKHAEDAEGGSIATTWAVTHSSVLDKKRGRVHHMSSTPTHQSTRGGGAYDRRSEGKIAPVTGVNDNITHATPTYDAVRGIRSDTVLQNYRDAVVKLAGCALPLSANEVWHAVPPHQ